MTLKKTTQKNSAPKSNLHLRNEDTNESSGDIEEYPLIGQVEPREKWPRGKKATTMEEDTPTRCALRMKNPRTSPPYSPSSSNEDEDNDNNDKEENGKDTGD